MINLYSFYWRILERCQRAMVRCTVIKYIKKLIFQLLLKKLKQYFKHIFRPLSGPFLKNDKDWPCGEDTHKI